MRLFIALEFEEHASYFTSLQQQLPQARATLPKHFHLTLKFLGEVPDDKLAAIKEKLGAVQFAGFSATLGQLGVFPDEHHIRVVWVGLEDHKHVEQLQQHIDDVLADMFERDTRFHAHLTLARIKQAPEDKKQFVQDLKKIRVEPKQVHITSFKLIKSTLTREGPEYEVLEEYK